VHNPLGDTQPSSFYCGEVRTQVYYGTVRVVADNGKLLVYAGHSTTPFVLEPYDGDTFREASGESVAKFDAGSIATAGGVWFGRYEAPGRSGAFVRATP